MILLPQKSSSGKRRGTRDPTTSGSRPWGSPGWWGARRRRPRGCLLGQELAYVLVLGPGPPPLGPWPGPCSSRRHPSSCSTYWATWGALPALGPQHPGCDAGRRGLGQGWAYCYRCQSQRPPRSGHCSACRRCVLRRDHHGRPLGRRVGFRSYRPCVCLLLHAAGVLLHVCVRPGPEPPALLRAHTPLHTAALLPLPRRGPLTGSVSGAVRAGLRDRHVCGVCAAVRGWTALPWDVAAEGPDHVGVGSGPALL